WSEFSTADYGKIKFIKDFGFGVIKIFGTLIAIVGTAQLLPLELENRTIYPILAKPVFRSEFLLGKFVGMSALLLLTLVLMGIIFAGVLLYSEHSMVAAINRGEPISADLTPQEAIQQVINQTRDLGSLKVMALIYFQLIMVCSIALVIATFST